MAFMLTAVALEMCQRQIGGFRDIECGDIAASCIEVIFGLLLQYSQMLLLLARIEGFVYQC
jgi:hypothetical protein